MIESIYKSKRTIEYLRMGPLGEHVEKLTESLLAKGYLPERLRLNFGVLSGLSHWMGVQSLKMGQLTPERIEEFLEFHKLYRKSGQRRVFIDAVDFFRAEKIIPQARISQVKCIEDRVLFDFERFLRDHRGVSEGYLKKQVYYGRMFLSEAFAKKRVNFRGLSVTDVTEFIKRHIPDNGSAETRHMVISLRSFFKFLQATNRVKKNLAVAIPLPAYWKETTLPIGLKADQVKRLLESYDRKTAIGKRDFAIVKMLSRLGLRSCEVINLCLKDLHWRSGEITVRGKGRESKLPLPKDVGAALIDYIKNARPQPSPHQHVFLSTFSNRGPFKRSASIASIVNLGIKRAKLSTARKGAHILRHTVASECLRNGANYGEIAELLRHENLATVSIYAKVDFERLKLAHASWLWRAKPKTKVVRQIRGAK